MRGLEPSGRGPQRGLQTWSLTVAPEMRQEVSKTGTSDDTICLDRPAWLGACLSRLKDQRPGKSVLFNVTPEQALRSWKQACLDLKIVADRYQLRQA